MSDDATGGAHTTGQDADPETAEKLGEIEQTRAAMHDTVEEIGDRLAPSTIVQNAKETVRDATVGKVEDMADSASQMFSDAGSTAQEAGYGIVETVRRNPIPAALAGIGIAWLVTHRASARPTSWDRAGWPERRRSETYSSSLDTGDRGVTESVSGTVDAVGQKVGDIGDRVGQKVDKGVDSLSQQAERVREVPDEMGYRVHDLSEQARSLIQDSPLAVGAVAVAVGTALGAALPATSMERRVLRPATEKAIGTAEETATKALSEMEREAGATSGSGTSSSAKSSSRSRSGTSASAAGKTRSGGGTGSQG
jgi:ElaB/YqjD/DUF883 family membrane-anchored ribosome-binding protein